MFLKEIYILNRLFNDDNIHRFGGGLTDMMLSVIVMIPCFCSLPFFPLYRKVFELQK